MSQCPECSFDSENPLDEEYGWCSRCRRFTGALEHVRTLTPEERERRAYWVTPGLERCCRLSLAAWVTLHPGPWEKGRWVRCLSPHAVMLYNGQVWLHYDEADHPEIQLVPETVPPAGEDTVHGEGTADLAA